MGWQNLTNSDENAKYHCYRFARLVSDDTGQELGSVMRAMRSRSRVIITLTKYMQNIGGPGRADANPLAGASSRCATRHAHGAGAPMALAPSELWSDVVVNQRNIRIPTQALYAAASALRSAMEEYVDWEDCAAAVALVLSAMENYGVLSFVLTESDIPPQEIAGTFARKGNSAPADRA